VVRKALANFGPDEIDEYLFKYQSRNSIDWFTMMIKASPSRRKVLTKRLESYSIDCDRKFISSTQSMMTKFLITANGKVYKTILFELQYYTILKVFHPDNDVLSILGFIFSDFSYYINKCECSFDFINLSEEESMAFLELNRRFMYIQYRGKALPLYYTTTDYKTRIRQHISYGIKGYIRSVEKFYRFEATLKRKFLMAYNIVHITDLYNLCPSVVLHRIRYLTIDKVKWQRLFHKIRKNDRYRIEVVWNEIQLLAKRSINDALNCAVRYVNGQRNITKMHHFELIFMAVTNDSFIKEDHPECMRLIGVANQEPSDGISEPPSRLVHLMMAKSMSETTVLGCDLFDVGNQSSGSA